MPRMAPIVTTPVPPTPSMIDAQPSLVERKLLRFGHPVERIGLAGNAFRLSELRAVHGDE